jgi:pyruvate dehydrogenase E2 component (dihydrolipoamide acetyltransferase)
MAKILEMPKLSPTMEEGVLAAWHKKEGDAIQIDDLLAEVETDKATMEFRSFDKGTLLKILVTPGSTVKLGQAVAVVGNPGEDVSALVARVGQGAAPAAATTQAPAAAAAPPIAATASAAAPPAAAATPTKVTTGSVLDRTARDAESPVDGEGRVLASPHVRQRAREMGIDLRGQHGSGPGGRVLPEDLERLPRAQAMVVGAPVAAPAPSAAALAKGAGLAEPEARPLTQMRKAIARRLTESKTTVPHFYLTIDVDAGPLVELREKINAELASDHVPEGEKPLKVSLNDLLIKACAAALVRVPECNATFTPEAILVHRRVDISVAVAIPDGLITPVVRDADKKSVVAISREVRDLAARARAKKLRPEEMMDGTFSISNLGMFGIDEFSAVINPPEGAILAVGRVRDVPVVEDGQVAAGRRLSMTLSCDHRVVDGAVGAAFLAELRALVERPMRVLTG